MNLADEFQDICETAQGGRSEAGYPLFIEWGRMTPPKVSLDIEALLSRRGKEMDMHFRRPESQRRQKFLVAVDALAQIAAFADVIGLPHSIESRSRKDVVARPEVREQVNRINVVYVPDPGRALPLPQTRLSGGCDLIQQIRQCCHSAKIARSRTMKLQHQVDSK
jgi:hypothetical protein